jgi:methylated-DNA-[protein]-cysteine S-methyltransferase
MGKSVDYSHIETVRKRLKPFDLKENPLTSALVRRESWQGVPLTYAGLEVMLWLREETPARLDFNRSETPPGPRRHGTAKVTKQRQSHWQKKLTGALRQGISAEELFLQGTDFQKSVWKKIQAIPFGETRTYLHIAQALGNPKAVRAVAQACGANPLPLLIPCHRVVGTGNLGGFAGGVALKQKLLSAEGLAL